MPVANSHSAANSRAPYGAVDNRNVLGELCLKDTVEVLGAAKCYQAV
eukprot:CAMPEP_0197621652 /NCGR_PEP_ID=MMETSP1338-20131121/2173_1 /TAXON_ID=43686 ORGANISM="Pelagodinium beii, Strain RCC1491" /NCGR_SAMPLE_ID=MMETSP1338 /ASSEMBLY_ACC=CAM_ASM_000754 /LENGTH=46 /DNA_ID= /DNA_START= /DNA_END= /DNA_ORIENTATION=